MAQRVGDGGGCSDDIIRARTCSLDVRRECPIAGGHGVAGGDRGGREEAAGRNSAGR